MKSVFSKLLKFTLFCIVVLLNAETSSARDVRVRLSEGNRFTITSTSAITLTDSKNKSFNLGKSLTLTISKGTATSGKTKYSLPVTLISSNALSFDGRKYRGTLKITSNGELVNVLNIEDYLRGVLKAEANSDWPMEYLKVQAIVSRTYAIRESLVAKSREYDVTNTTSSQVYHGMNAETRRTDQAVRDTNDKVLAYGNELAFTPFHSDSGGATANNADVWGKDLPYLRGVKEPMTYQSPNSSWEAHISSSEITTAMNKVSPNLGTVKDIIILNTDKYGRAVDIKITGSASSATIKASAFRTVVGSNKIKSTFLVLPAANNTKQVTETTITTTKTTTKTETKTETKTPPKVNTNTEAKTPPKVDTNTEAKTPPKINSDTSFNEALTPEEDTLLSELFSGGVFTNKEMMDILLYPEKRKEYLYRAIVRRDPNQTKQDTKNTPVDDTDNRHITAGASIPFSNGHFIFQGKGWGHGVGMSQYGAMNLATSGWKAENILTHYFPGTKVKTATTEKK